MSERLARMKPCKRCGERAEAVNMRCSGLSWIARVMRPHGCFRTGGKPCKTGLVDTQESAEKAWDFLFCRSDYAEKHSPIIPGVPVGDLAHLSDKDRPT